MKTQFCFQYSQGCGTHELVVERDSEAYALVLCMLGVAYDQRLRLRHILVERVQEILCPHTRRQLSDFHGVLGALLYLPLEGKVIRIQSFDLTGPVAVSWLHRLHDLLGTTFYPAS
jgi:hypothetical protein